MSNLYSIELERQLDELEEMDMGMEYEGQNGRIYLYFKGDPIDNLSPPKDDYIRLALGFERIH